MPFRAPELAKAILVPLTAMLLVLGGGAAGAEYERDEEGGSPTVCVWVDKYPVKRYVCVKIPIPSPGAPEEDPTEYDPFETGEERDTHGDRRTPGSESESGSSA